MKKFLLGILFICSISLNSNAFATEQPSDWSWEDKKSPIGMSLLSLLDLVMGNGSGDTIYYRADHIHFAEQLLDRYFSIVPLDTLDSTSRFKLKLVALIIAVKYGEDLAVWTQDFYDYQTFFSLKELNEAELHILETIGWKLKPVVLKTSERNFSVSRGNLLRYY